MATGRLPYVENGCRHWHDCYTCPFADCIASYAVVDPYAQGDLDSTIRELRAKGVTPAEIAKQLKISERTVFRRAKNVSA